MFFHRGQGTPRVRMNEVVADKARHLPYDSDDFDFGRNTLAACDVARPRLRGHSRHYHLNGPQYKDELIVFWVRATSARSPPEHVRVCRRAAWPSTRSAVRARSSPLHRILDREARLRRAPAAHVRAARLAARERRVSVRRRRRATRRSWKCASGSTYARPIATLGVAPLTGMYEFGENQPHRVRLQARGARLRRPDGCHWRRRVALAAPDQSEPNVDRLVFDARSSGFGLMQRDRSFTSYEDPEARYDLRPSVQWTDGHGAPAASSSCRSTPRTRRTTTLSRTGCRTNCRARRAARLRVPPALAKRAHRYAAAGAWVTQSRVGRGYRELADDEQQFMVDFIGPRCCAHAERADQSHRLGARQTARSSRRTRTTSRPRARGA